MTVKVKNPDDLPVADINAQMREPRPLPIGRTEFEEWAERIIAGAMIPGATAEDQKYALGGMIMALGPTESHKPDAHFIHSLRKVACSQTAHTIMQEIYFKRHPEKKEAMLAAEAKGKETMDRVGVS